MTATPSSMQRKKRPATYGKKQSPATFGGDLDFFTEEHGSRSLSQSIVKQQKDRQKTHSPRMDGSGEQVMMKTPTVAAAKPQLLNKDTFDVPSSESDEDQELAQRPVRRVTAKRPLVDDRERQLAKRPAWSDKRPRLEASSPKKVSFADVHDEPSPISLPVHSKNPASPATSRVGARHISDAVAMQGLSASERLKYRRALETGRITYEDIAESNPGANGKQKAAATSKAFMKSGRPTSPSNASSRRPQAIGKPIATSQDSSRSRVRPAGPGSRESFDDAPMDGDQLPPDESRPSTPVRSDSAGKNTQHNGELTPKQKHIWQDLWANLEEPAEDNDASSMAITPRGKAKVEQNSALSHRSQSRLVDRLRAASAQRHDSDSELEDTDTEMTESHESTPGKSAVESVTHGGQSRPATTRLTYTQQRSYLAEDNLEDAMLLNLASASLPPTPRLHKKSGATSQSASTFDMDDDEPEATGGRIRSVHELRAQGKSSRMTAEVDELLHDIGNKARSAQRTIALIKLAENLFDADFAKTFINSGHDRTLLRTLDGTADDLSKTVYVIALLLLLTYDLPVDSLELMKASVLTLKSLLGTAGDINSLLAKKTVISAKISVPLSKLSRKIGSSSAVWSNGLPGTLKPRTMCLRTLELLVAKLRQSGDTSALLDDEDLALMCPPTIFSKNDEDIPLVISILEALSLASPSWPSSLVETVATLPAAMAHSTMYTQHTKFLSYRLCLNVTNNRTIDHFFFARSGALESLLTQVIDGFTHFGEHTSEDEEQRKLDFDLLILAIGIMINLSEYSKAVREAILKEQSAVMLSALVHIFQTGHEQAREAESVDESTGNVAYGYLSIMLANLCQESRVRELVKTQLGDAGLDSLIVAVEEFVQHHQRVDRTNFEGIEGQKVWSLFTERLKHVLDRLKKSS